MSVELATGYVSIVPTATGIGGSMAKLLGGPAQAAGAVAGKQAGQGIASGVASGSAGIGATLKKAAVLPILGVGIAAFASAKNVDAAYNIIRAGTGKTGESLKGLQDSFKNVAGQTPADLAQVAEAVAQVSSRLGLTGEPLEKLSLGLVRISRLTGTDLKSNVGLLTRVFGDWSIKTDGQAKALDKVFRASQLTGAGIDSLSQNVVQFGAPLRQLGFDFEESIALFGKFEAEGVNIGTVFSGLKFGLKTFAKAGKEPAKALKEVMLAIKNAGSTADANKIAFASFGARAGPDLAAAIREGRFEIRDLVKQITSGKDSIAAAAGDTSTLAGKFGVLKNQAQLALAEIGKPVLEGFTNALKVAMPLISRFAEVFESLPGPIKTAASALVLFALLRGPIGALGARFAFLVPQALSAAAATEAVGAAAVTTTAQVQGATVGIGAFGARIAAGAGAAAIGIGQFVTAAGALTGNPAVLSAILSNFIPDESEVDRRWAAISKTQRKAVTQGLLAAERSGKGFEFLSNQMDRAQAELKRARKAFADNASDKTLAPFERAEARVDALKASFKAFGKQVKSAGGEVQGSIATFEQLGNIKVPAGILAGFDAKGMAAFQQTVVAAQGTFGDFTTQVVLNSGITAGSFKTLTDEAIRTAGSIRGAFASATTVVGAFGGETTISGDQFLGKLREMQTAAQDFATGLKLAAALGVDTGLLKTIAEAGPKALPELKGLLDAVRIHGVGAINETQFGITAATDAAVGTLTARQASDAVKFAQWGTTAGTAGGKAVGDAMTNSLVPAVQRGVDRARILIEGLFGTFGPVSRGSGIKSFGSGGRLRANEPAIVGERGRAELWWPDTAGTIIPQSAASIVSGASAPVVVNLYALKPDAAVGRMIGEAVDKYRGRGGRRGA